MISMRLLFGILFTLLLSACSPSAIESGFGSRAVPAACVAAAAPWILGDNGAAEKTNVQASAAPALRAVTFNVHSGFGPQNPLFQSRASVEEHLSGIAQVIAASSTQPVDIVGLNEVDFAARRTGGIDQAQYLATMLERLTGQRYEVVYGQTKHRRIPGFEVRFGNAALVRHPVLAVKTCMYDNSGDCGLPQASEEMPLLRAAGVVSRLAREGRGLIKLTFDFHGKPIDAIVTHLDAVVLPEREAQAAHLLRRFVEPGHTTVVLGDFNTVPTVMTYTRAFFVADRTHDILTSGGLGDARVLYAARHNRSDFKIWATYPAAAPVWPLDGILGSLDLFPADVRVVRSEHSDHHGLFVQYQPLHDPAAIAAQHTRHNAIRERQLAQILDCDVVGESVAKARWLISGTGFADMLPQAERKRLPQVARPL
jgi:endonuclease/exonuclease/phosphatase family metal-dependent hydrolase